MIASKHKTISYPKEWKRKRIWQDKSSPSRSGPLYVFGKHAESIARRSPMIGFDVDQAISGFHA